MARKIADMRGASSEELASEVVRLSDADEQENIRLKEDLERYKQEVDEYEEKAEKIKADLDEDMNNVRAARELIASIPFL